MAFKKNGKETVAEAEKVESVDLDTVFPAEEESGEPGSELESLLDVDMTPEDVARMEESLALATGTYMWKTPEKDEKIPTVTITFNDQDRKATDIQAKNGRGRCQISVGGFVVETETKKQGRFNFMVSPDAREFKGDLDFMSQNYARFTALYFRIHEEKGINPKKIAQLISSGKYTMYIARAKNGGNFLNRVNELKAKE